jgi:YegS/Rv2252/BmrU family lipid kinase
MSRIWFIIVNPAAGNGEGLRQWQVIQKLLKEYAIQFNHAITKNRGHASILAEEAIKNGYRKIAGVGGDGTNHEIVNGILNQTIVASQKIVYTLLPVGTGNDWIRSHGISRNLDQAVRNLLEGVQYYQDAGLIEYEYEGKRNTRYFANVAGLAFDAYVVVQSDQQAGIWSGKLFYLFHVLKNLLSYRVKKSLVIFDHVRKSGYFYTINIGLCRFSGGGMQIVPHAKGNDGLFGLTLAHKMSKLRVVLNTHLFYNGKIGKHPKVELFHAKRIEIKTTSTPILLEADGEFLGQTPAQFSILPKALNILRPKVEL